MCARQPPPPGSQHHAAVACAVTLRGSDWSGGAWSMSPVVPVGQRNKYSSLLLPPSAPMARRPGEGEGGGGEDGGGWGECRCVVSARLLSIPGCCWENIIKNEPLVSLLGINLSRLLPFVSFTVCTVLYGSRLTRALSSLEPSAPPLFLYIYDRHLRNR